jgi:Amt family ammonium transporter
MLDFSLVSPSLLGTVFLGQAGGADTTALVEKATAALKDPKVIADTLWVLLTAMLVFWMNAGFATLETGLCRRKNAVNILSKNFIVFAISSLAYWAVGFGLMFANGTDYVGLGGFFPSLVSPEAGVDLSPLTNQDYQGNFSALSWTGVPLGAKFFFQLVFAGTAATIVSGAVAERIKYGTFMVFSFIIVAVIYSIPGHWIWGGGWLAKMNFFDFAGSTQVHSIGGWAALAGVIMLGPRLGKYRADGGVNPIPGHNMGLAAIGTFILWLGWFGFNPGSTMAADPVAISNICITTNTAGAMGAVTATIVAWILFKKPDLSMTLNGCLAGLVAVTAPCAFVSVFGALWIGLVAGVLVVFGVLFFDKVKLDDPVGALSVHLLNGVWGTLSLGLFALPKADPAAAGPSTGLFYGGGATQLIAQLTGVGATAAFVFVTAMIAWAILKATMGIRVSREEEIEGLDLGEHGMEAYPGFAKEEGREPAEILAGAVAPAPKASVSRAHV